MYNFLETYFSVYTCLQMRVRQGARRNFLANFFGKQILMITIILAKFICCRWRKSACCCSSRRSVKFYKFFSVAWPHACTTHTHTQFTRQSILLREYFDIGIYIFFLVINIARICHAPITLRIIVWRAYIFNYACEFFFFYEPTKATKRRVRKEITFTK